MQVARQQSERLVSCASRVFVRWASKKQGGSTSNGRDSQPKYLGLKAGGGEVRARAERTECPQHQGLPRVTLLFCADAPPRGSALAGAQLAHHSGRTQPVTWPVASTEAPSQ